MKNRMSSGLLIDIANALIGKRKIISLTMLVAGAFIAATVCYFEPWFGLQWDYSPPRKEKSALIMVPVFSLIALASIAAVVSLIVRSRTGEELGRLDDIKPVGPNDSSLIGLLKIAYLLLGSAVVFIGGYFAVAMNTVIIFYFNIRH